MSDNLAGFKLADGYEDFSGGTFTYGANQAVFDVGEALKQSSDGVIVTDDPYLTEGLRGYEALQEVAAPEGVAPVDAPGGMQIPETPSGVGFIPQSGAIPEEQAPAEDAASAAEEAAVATQTPPGGDKTAVQRIAAANAPAEHADDDDSGITSGR